MKRRTLDASTEGRSVLEAVQILHVTLAGRGGSASYVADLACAQARSGMTVGAIVPADYDLMSKLEDANVAVVVLPGVGDIRGSFLGTVKRVLGGAFHIAKLLRAVGRISSVKVVHFNFVSPGLSQLITSVAAWNARFASLITMHDVVPHHMRTAPLFAALDIVCHWIAFRLVGAVHIHTVAQKRSLQRVYQMDESRCVVIPHGISQNVVAATQRPPPRSSTTFLVIGALRKNKNIKQVVEAFAELWATYSNAHLVIAGRVPRSEVHYWAECRDVIARSRASVQVIEGHLSEERFSGLLLEADCVLLPYSSFSSQSGVVLRAASAGVPVIASSDVQIDDVPIGLISDELQLERVDRVEIRRAMLQFLRMSPQRRKEVGDRLRVLCQSKLSWETVGRRFQSIYEGLIRTSVDHHKP
jgi:glycosyltransferase involved in cell wall biosynthesis